MCYRHTVHGNSGKSYQFRLGEDPGGWRLLLGLSGSQTVEAVEQQTKSAPVTQTTVTLTYCHQPSAREDDIRMMDIEETLESAKGRNTGALRSRWIRRKIIGNHQRKIRGLKNRRTKKRNRRKPRKKSEPKKPHQPCKQRKSFSKCSYR
ncbi:hypothetical protein J6590_088919 [Homalodisca vitripennis]|nr:hypothetical protein J6590_088919 [Homalodisca vitripennis]